MRVVTLEEHLSVPSVVAKIDKAVTDRKLTAEQATALKATVLNAATTLVDRKAPAKATTP